MFVHCLPHEIESTAKSFAPQNFDGFKFSGQTQNMQFHYNTPLHFEHLKCEYDATKGIVSPLLFYSFSFVIFHRCVHNVNFTCVYIAIFNFTVDEKRKKSRLHFMNIESAAFDYRNFNKSNKVMHDLVLASLSFLFGCRLLTCINKYVLCI